MVLLSGLDRLLNSGLKELVQRPRPSPELVQVGGQPPPSFSFPSGHADGAVVLYGLLFYFVTVYVPVPWLRLPLQALCLWVVLFTGMERVYVGHHWPSDVVGGYWQGALVLAGLIALHRLAVLPRRG